MWMAHKLPETFRQAACLSGALQVRDRHKKSFIDFVKERERVDLRIYLDCGTVQDGAPQSRKLHQAYLARGWHDGEAFATSRTKAANIMSAPGVIVSGAAWCFFLETQTLPVCFDLHILISLENSWLRRIPAAFQIVSKKLRLRCTKGTHAHFYFLHLPSSLCFI